jgi:hypothetical protein
MTEGEEMIFGGRITNERAKIAVHSQIVRYLDGTLQTTFLCYAEGMCAMCVSHVSCHQRNFKEFFVCGKSHVWWGLPHMWIPC